MLKSGNFKRGNKSPYDPPRQSSDFDNDAREELFEDLLRDFEQARQAQERARQRSSCSEQSSRDSDDEYSGEDFKIPGADNEEECPVCQEYPCKLFKRVNPVFEHNENPADGYHEDPAKEDDISRVYRAT